MEVDKTRPFEPYVPDITALRDFSLKAALAGVIFGALFGTANAYLGLKVGLTIGTSIPLAVIMVALFRSLRRVWPNTGILEWNIGQAAGSSSSSLASGLIFTTDKPAASLYFDFTSEATQLCRHNG